jgi:hypothetical protein
MQSKVQHTKLCEISVFFFHDSRSSRLPERPPFVSEFHPNAYDHLETRFENLAVAFYPVSFSLIEFRDPAHVLQAFLATERQAARRGHDGALRAPDGSSPKS